MIFIKKEEIPLNRQKDLTYGRIVVAYRPQKKEKFRARLAVGGDRINRFLQLRTYFFWRFTRENGVRQKRPTAEQPIAFGFPPCQQHQRPSTVAPIPSPTNSRPAVSGRTRYCVAGVIAIACTRTPGETGEFRRPARTRNSDVIELPARRKRLHAPPVGALEASWRSTVQRSIAGTALDEPAPRRSIVFSWDYRLGISRHREFANAHPLPCHPSPPPTQIPR